MSSNLWVLKNPKLRKLKLEDMLFLLRLRSSTKAFVVCDMTDSNFNTIEANTVFCEQVMECEKHEFVGTPLWFVECGRRPRPNHQSLQPPAAQSPSRNQEKIHAVLGLESKAPIQVALEVFKRDQSSFICEFSILSFIRQGTPICFVAILESTKAAVIPPTPTTSPTQASRSYTSTSGDASPSLLPLRLREGSAMSAVSGTPTLEHCEPDLCDSEEQSQSTFLQVKPRSHNHRSTTSVSSSRSGSRVQPASLNDLLEDAHA